MTDESDKKPNEDWELLHNLRLADIGGYARRNTQLPHLTVLVIGSALTEMNRRLLPDHLELISSPPPVMICLLHVPRTSLIQLSGHVDDVLLNHRMLDRGFLELLDMKPLLVEDLLAQERAHDMAPLLDAVDKLMLRDRLPAMNEPITLEIKAFHAEALQDLSSIFGHGSARHIRRAAKHQKPIPPPSSFAPPRVLKSFRKR